MKILIVEDDPSLREVMASALKKEGHTVESAEDFHSASEKLELYSYDCILLDIMLPGGSGLELLSLVKKKDTKANVIIISAKDSIDDKVSGLELGAERGQAQPYERGLFPEIRKCRSRAGDRKGVCGRAPGGTSEERVFHT